MLESTLLVRVEKEKSLVNHRFTRDLRYPDPGSNRDGLLHWCLRPARLPIPPSGLNAFLLSGAKVGIKNGLVKYLERKIVIFIEKTYDIDRDNVVER